MKRIFGVLSLLFALMPSCGAQLSQTDSQTLQAILAELRQMHSELRTQQAQNQAMQILLFQMQTQQSLINHATQRVEDTRAKLSEVQEAERHVTAESIRSEELLRTSTDELEKKTLAAEVERSKSELANLKTSEQDRSATLQQAEAELKKAQDTFDNIEDQLDQLVKILQAPGQQHRSN